MPLSDAGLVQYVRMLAMFVVALGHAAERERAPPFSHLPQGRTGRASHSACASAYVNCKYAAIAVGVQSDIRTLITRQAATWRRVDAPQCGTHASGQGHGRGGGGAQDPALQLVRDFLHGQADEVRDLPDGLVRDQHVPAPPKPPTADPADPTGARDKTADRPTAGFLACALRVHPW